MSRPVCLLLLLGLIAAASAQRDILAFFTDSACSIGNSQVPAPTSFSVGACQALPGAPANFPGGDHFNVTSVGVGFTFNTACDSTCTFCNSVNLDLSVCTPLPGAENNVWVQYFQLVDEPLFVSGFLDASCKIEDPFPSVKVSSGSCADTNFGITKRSFFSATQSNNLVIATSCNADCTNCAGIYKRSIGQCIDIVENAAYVTIGVSSAASVSASIGVIIAALFALAL